jgi:hypothetical protein
MALTRGGGGGGNYTGKGILKSPGGSVTPAYMQRGGGTAIPRVSPASSPAARTPIAAAAPVAGGTGGGDYSGGGGGGYGAAAPAPIPRRSLEQVIAEDFARRQIEEENARQEREFDAETSRLRGDVERDQAVRRDELQTDLQDMSVDSAEDLAGRGLLYSGGLLQNQDRINSEGVRREGSIAELLSSFLGDRGSSRLALQQRGRGALNDRYTQLTGDYAAGRIN